MARRESSRTNNAALKAWIAIDDTVIRCPKRGGSEIAPQRCCSFAEESGCNAGCREAPRARGLAKKAEEVIRHTASPQLERKRYPCTTCPFGTTARAHGVCEACRTRTRRERWAERNKPVHPCAGCKTPESTRKPGLFCRKCVRAMVRGAPYGGKTKR